MKNLKWSKSILFLFVTLSVSSIFILGCKDLIEPKTVPSVVTGDVSNATGTSATVGGQIVTDGNATVSDRGVVIGKNADPTINDTKVTSGNGVGTFSVDLSGLSPATTYHVRAYGTNAVGTSYGLDKSFTTSAIAPTLTTTDAISITYTTATIGGNISSDGGSAVLTRGICYGTSPNPTTANQKTTEGSGTGAFSSNITSLSVSTKYYARAYATNAVGTSYGNEISFTTLTPVLPTVTTTAISGITVSSSKSGGNITNDGGSPVTARGVCWGVNPNPTIADNKTTDGSGSGTFISSITKLTSSKKYYVRAYATNSVGTSYGEELNFTTPSSPIPINGLVGWWPFNGNANDESGNGYDGIVTEATLTLDRFNKSNSAYSFDGINDYITTGDINLSSATISLWVNPKGQYGAFVDKNGESAQHSGYTFMYNNANRGLYGHVGWSGVSLNNIYPEPPKQLNLEQWNYCVLTYENGTAKIHLNGELFSTRTGLSSIGQNNDLLLFGKSVWGGNLFSGKLDDIAIYNRALTADEILKIYNGTGF